MNHRAALAALLLALSTAWPMATSAQGPGAIRGQVLEVQNVEGYTYLRLKTRDGEVWAAVSSASVKPGAVVNIGNSMTMENFESATLKKRFDKIIFGAIVETGAVASAHPGAAAPLKVEKVEKVAKASGPQARTVAELVQGKAALKDKAVVLQARVVKVNNGIMGKNWWHLQDGSGTVQDSSHDVLVTTQDTAVVGDLVTVRGTVRTDVTLGAGYAFDVMVEDAKSSK
jgi:DNA/RNA endonuclease YhcR with UshA esterase domain